MWIFDASGFLPRSHCAADGFWPVWLQNLNQIGNLEFFLAYMIIPFMLFRFLRRFPRDGSYESRALMRPVLLKFIVFIFLCGTKHLFDVVVFWWPAYRLDTLNVLIGGTFSLWVAATVPAHLALASGLRSPDDVRRAWDRVAELERYHGDRAVRVKDLLGELEALAWNEGAAYRLDRIRKIADELDIRQDP